LLFISNNRIAFCSERSIKVTSSTGKLLKVHYKVMIPLEKINRAAASANAKKSTQKYVQIVTEDNFEFWFLGFLNHQRTLKNGSSRQGGDCVGGSPRDLSTLTKREYVELMT
ncbi:gem-like protein 7, partial [Phtheirospermum japonicum]